MVVINIPADGLFLAVQNHANGDFSESNCKHIINEYIGRFLKTEPDVILLNVCYRRCLTPSRVFDSYLYDIETDENGFAIKDAKGESIKNISPNGPQSVSKYFKSFLLCGRELLSKGIDIYKFAIERIRETNCQVFMSLRMNDAHYIENVAINSSFALKNNSVHTIEKDGRNLDFSQEAVQNYYYSYIKELLNDYSIDGIEMDWLRHPTVLSNEKRLDFSIIGNYMKRVRALISSYNKKASLAVRLLSSEEENLAKGFDVCSWIADGSVDILTIENFYIPTNYELPIDKWRESIFKRNYNNNPYRLLGGCDWGVSCVGGYNIAMTPSLVRGFVETCLDGGADGVYLFNFFEENDISSFEFVVDSSGEGHLENCFFERMIAAKQHSVLPRRYVHIGKSNNRYPIHLEVGGQYTFTKAFNCDMALCNIIIGCDKDIPLLVSVNGELAYGVSREPVCKNFEYLPKEEVCKSHFIYATTQLAPFLYRWRLPFDSTKKTKFNIQIENKSSTDVNLLWIEFFAE